MRVLLEDDLGRLTLRQLWPWHRMTARLLAARLDRRLAGGACPEAAPDLAVRAIRLTSTEFRRDLASNLQQILAAAGLSADDARARTGASRVLPVAAHPSLGVAREPHVPVHRPQVGRSAPELRQLVGQLIQPGPVPVRGVAMVSQLLADGSGPLYRQASRDDLTAIVHRAVQALTRLRGPSPGGFSRESE
jgi:hypothetical protein